MEQLTNTKRYKFARFVEGSRQYIVYYVWNTKQEKLQRVRDYSPEKYTGFSREIYVKDRIKQINKLLEKGAVYNPSYNPRRSKSPRLMDELQKFVLTKQSGRKRTYEVYKSNVKVLGEYLGAKNLQRISCKDVTKKIIWEYLDWLVEERQIGARTYNNYLRNTKTMFNYLINREIIKENPCRGISKKKVERGRNIAFTPKEQKVLEAWLKHNNVRLYYITRFIYYCFLRPNEVLGLRIKDIDLVSARIMVKSSVSKSGIQGACIIPSPLMELLKGMDLDKYPSHWYLFGSDTEIRKKFTAKQWFIPSPKREYRNRASEQHRTAIEQSGLAKNNDITMYSWKHTGVVKAYRNGTDLKALQMQCRHSNLDMTNTYLKSLGLESFTLPDW